MNEYPMHEKLASVADASQAAGEFMEWCEAQGYSLHFYREGKMIPLPVLQSTETLIAEWLGIDRAALESEKRAMLAAIREQTAQTQTTSEILGETLDLIQESTSHITPDYLQSRLQEIRSDESTENGTT